MQSISSFVFPVLYDGPLICSLAEGIAVNIAFQNDIKCVVKESIYRQTDTTVLNPVIFPEVEGGWIHHNVVSLMILNDGQTDRHHGFKSGDIPRS